jgi:hypothetical protein
VNNRSIPSKQQLYNHNSFSKISRASTALQSRSFLKKIENFLCKLVLVVVVMVARRVASGGGEGGGEGGGKDNGKGGGSGDGDGCGVVALLYLSP